MFNILKPVLFSLDAEKAHHLTIQALKKNIVPPIQAINDPTLRMELCGRVFLNPVGLAAGFDKNAEVILPMLKLGFGFVEVGTVTIKPQTGNPKPRVFRDPKHGAVINRMGFPNKGVGTFKSNLHKFLVGKPRPQGVVGINIGMNKDQTDPAADYTALIRTLGPLSDYITINISSPNTPGLRNLQEKEPLTELLSAVLDERKKSCGIHPPPIFVKLAPDLDDDQVKDIADVLLSLKIDGVILTNTTLYRPEELPEEFRSQKGGLSGAPLTDLSTAMIRRFYTLTNGRIPIIGAGGISSGEDAYAKIRAGASLVQLYSGLIFHGPGLIRKINLDLLELLRSDGFSHITEAVGADHKI